MTACGGGVTRPSAVTFVAAAGAGGGINIKTQPLLAITSAPHCKVTVARDSVLQKTGKLVLKVELSTRTVPGEGPYLDLLFVESGYKCFHIY